MIKKRKTSEVEDLAHLVETLESKISQLLSQPVGEYYTGYQWIVFYNRDIVAKHPNGDIQVRIRNETEYGPIYSGVDWIKREHFFYYGDIYGKIREDIEGSHAGNSND